MQLMKYSFREHHSVKEYKEALMQLQQLETECSKQTLNEELVLCYYDMILSIEQLNKEMFMVF